MIQIPGYTEPMHVYLREQYPNDEPLLSVVVGRTAYCIPRESNLRRHEYTHVEVGIVFEDGLVSTECLRPWLPDHEYLGEDEVICLSVTELDAVRAGMREKYGEPSPATGGHWSFVRE